MSGVCLVVTIECIMLLISCSQRWKVYLRRQTDSQSGTAEDSAAIIIANHLKYTEVEGKKRECEKVPVIVADSSHRTEKTVSLLLIDK